VKSPTVLVHVAYATVAVDGWSVSVERNVTAVELRPVNVTCTTDYTDSPVTYTWTSRSHQFFQQTSQSLWIDRATTDVAGSYECTVETADRRQRKWAAMYLNVLCQYIYVH